MADMAGSVAERRARFILRLRNRGIRDLAVLRALERSPRDLFVPHRYGDLAMHDVALPIDCGQTMPEPFFAARIAETLEMSGTERVLEIGTGSGYVTALLAGLAGEVLSLEWFAVLAEAARLRLEALAITNAAVVCANGLCVRPDIGLFDRIVVHGLMDDPGDRLRGALARGGRLAFARRTGAGQFWVVCADKNETQVTPSRLRPLIASVSADA